MNREQESFQKLRTGETCTVVCRKRSAGRVLCDSNGLLPHDAHVAWSWCWNGPGAGRVRDRYLYCVYSTGKLNWAHDLDTKDCFCDYAFTFSSAQRPFSPLFYTEWPKLIVGFQSLHCISSAFANRNRVNKNLMKWIWQGCSCLISAWIRGYDLKSTAESLAACVKCLLGDELEAEDGSAGLLRPADRYQRIIDEVSVPRAFPNFWDNYYVLFINISSPLSILLVWLVPICSSFQKWSRIQLPWQIWLLKVKKSKK